MKHRVSAGGFMPLPWAPDSEFEALAKPAILLVEDDDDIRDLTGTLMRIAGFDPEPCRTAEEGLERLREQQFDLVLTDYMLPNRSGGWLLHQASSEGLLDATPALVVTAHPNPRDLQGFEVIHKPFDLDELVERVKQRLDTGRNSAGPRRPRRAAPNRASRGHDDDCPDPIELILYVSAQSPVSAIAIENIKSVLTRYKSSRVRLTICDVSKGSKRGAEDGVPCSRSAEKRLPGPRTCILGHITNPELFLELLEGCEES